MAALISTPMMVVASATTFASPRSPAAGLPACLPPPARTPVLGGSAAALRGQSWAATTPSTSRATRMNVLAAADPEDDDDEEEEVERPGDDDEEERERPYRAPRPVADNFEEQVVQVTRVTKVVKGGKQLSFRAVVVVGDKQGKVGVGCAAAKEVVQAVQKAAAKARQECVTVPITRGQSFPHRVEGRHGAAKVMMRPAAEGCGVIAGGATRVVMELAGIRNGFGKQIGTDNPLNNARAAVEGLSRLRTWKQVSDSRGIPVSVLMNIKADA